MLSPLTGSLEPLGVRRGGSAAAFDPASLSLSFWIRADSGLWQESTHSTAATADGDRVGGADDRTANNRDADQATANSRPTLKTGANGINSHNILRGDGTDDHLAVAYNANTGPLTALSIALVVRPNIASEGSKGFFSWAGSAASGTPFILINRSTTCDVFVNNGYRWNIAHTAGTAKSYILTWDSTTWKLWVNGVAQSNYIGGQVGRNTAANIYLLSGFAMASNSDIPEAMARGSVFTTQEVSDLSGYFTSRYGL
jgi:hypothetical protein